MASIPSEEEEATTRDSVVEETFNEEIKEEETEEEEAEEEEQHVAVKEEIEESLEADATDAMEAKSEEEEAHVDDDADLLPGEIKEEEPPEVKEQVPEEIEAEVEPEEIAEGVAGGPMTPEPLETMDETPQQHVPRLSVRGPEETAMAGRSPFLSMEIEVEYELLASMQESDKRNQAKATTKAKGVKRRRQTSSNHEKLERVILQALKKHPPKHEYFGLVFSSQSKRAPSYYKNYFLPIQKQPLPHQHVKILGKQVPPHDILCNPMVTGKGNPVSAVKVRWMLNIRHTVYTIDDIYAYLIRYGPIENLYQVAANAIVVVFSNMSSALAAVKDPDVGFPWDPLIVTWVDPRMNNFGNVQKHPLQMMDTIL